jgi:hypothetical protein
MRRFLLICVLLGGLFVVAGAIWTPRSGDAKPGWLEPRDGPPIHGPTYHGFD